MWYCIRVWTDDCQGDRIIRLQKGRGRSIIRGGGRRGRGKWLVVLWPTHRTHTRLAQTYVGPRPCNESRTQSCAQYSHTHAYTHGHTHWDTQCTFIRRQIQTDVIMTCMQHVSSNLFSRVLSSKHVSLFICIYTHRHIYTHTITKINTWQLHDCQSELSLSVLISGHA